MIATIVRTRIVCFGRSPRSAKAGYMDIHEDHPDLPRLAKDGEVVAYFGYGSLVNRRTLRTKFLGIRRARASGWQRFWVPRIGTAQMALLSVVPVAGESVDGVVVYDLADHLPSVDEREAGYVRQIVEPGLVTIDKPPVGDVPLYIYEAPLGVPDAEQPQAAILQSYLDAVLQGFHDLYGEEGVRRFVAETRGFETSVLRDRSVPRYPRSVQLDPELAAFFDGLVVKRGARFRAADGASGTVFAPSPGA